MKTTKYKFTSDEKELLSMLSEPARSKVEAMLIVQKDILSRIDEQVEKVKELQHD